MVVLRTHDIMIFGGMNGKLASKSFFWKWISCTEGENVEMSIPNSHERSRLNYFVFDCFIFFFQPKKISYIFDWVVINFSFGLKRFFYIFNNVIFSFFETAFAAPKILFKFISWAFCRLNCCILIMVGKKCMFLTQFLNNFPAIYKKSIATILGLEPLF